MIMTKCRGNSSVMHAVMGGDTGEAFTGYSLDTPSTTARCQAALLAAMEEDEGDDAAAAGLSSSFGALVTK
jgi:hypothetical protein